MANFFLNANLLNRYINNPGIIKTFNARNIAVNISDNFDGTTNPNISKQLQPQKTFKGHGVGHGQIVLSGLGINTLIRDQIAIEIKTRRAIFVIFFM